MLKTQIERAWLISDIHFGVRSSSLEWVEIQKRYFYDFLIPTIKENKKENDALFVLGDVFESRQSLNILVMFESLKIFKHLSTILPIYIIVGNHDIYKKFSNDINSLEIFKSLKNVTILKDPEQIIFKNNVKGLFLPWKDTHKQEMEVINEDNSDYLFCHTDIAGFKYNRRIMMLGGIDPGTMEKYKKVYTGHIHLSQHRKNIRVIGAPYQLTRSDINNKKSIWLVDFINEKEVSFENKISPKFLKIKLENILHFTLQEIQEKFRNNFIDILVDDKWSTTFPFGQFTELFNNYRKINFILTGTEENEEEETQSDIEISNLILAYINKLSYNEKLKNKIIEKSLELYLRAQKMLDEKNSEL